MMVRAHIRLSPMIRMPPLPTPTAPKAPHTWLGKANDSVKYNMPNSHFAIVCVHLADYNMDVCDIVTVQPGGNTHLEVSNEEAMEAGEYVMNTANVLCGTNFSSFSLHDAKVQLVHGQIYTVTVEVGGLELPPVSLTRDSTTGQLLPPAAGDAALRPVCTRLQAATDDEPPMHIPAVGLTDAGIPLPPPNTTTGAAAALNLLGVEAPARHLTHMQRLAQKAAHAGFFLRSDSNFASKADMVSKMGTFIDKRSNTKLDKNAKLVSATASYDPAVSMRVTLFYQPWALGASLCRQ